LLQVWHYRVLSKTLQVGYLILLLKPFELDDSILAQGQDGKVISIQIFYTVLLTADNKTVIIPNGKLFNEVITNVTREGKRRLDFELKLEYAADVDIVKEVIILKLLKKQIYYGYTGQALV
jgi:small conductance mechanosensitive channel